MKNTISNSEVWNFKERYCNENHFIIKFLRLLNHTIEEPILDVGTGLGDITRYAFSDKEVICIDVNPPENEITNPKHQRIVVDFFDYVPAKSIKTVFISHALQFLDSDIYKLNTKISQINPEKIILVLNDNNDFMGEILQWIALNGIQANPETNVNGFPEGYILTDTYSLQAILVCDTFEKLARQISYLMLFELTPAIEEKLIHFLMTKMNVPTFTINQSIKIYLKYHGKQ